MTLEFNDEKRDEALCIFCRQQSPMLHDAELLEKIKKYEDHTSNSVSAMSEHERSCFAKIVCAPTHRAVGAS